VNTGLFYAILRVGQLIVVQVPVLLRGRDGRMAIDSAAVERRSYLAHNRYVGAFEVVAARRATVGLRNSKDCCSI
jgi:hypothetical protein